MTSRKSNNMLSPEVEAALDGIPLPVIERYIERRAKLRRLGDSTARCPEMSYEHGQERCVHGVHGRDVAHLYASDEEP